MTYSSIFGENSDVKPDIIYSNDYTLSKMFVLLIIKKGEAQKKCFVSVAFECQGPVLHFCLSLLFFLVTRDEIL